MRTATRNVYRQGLEAVLQYVLAHLDEELDAQTLADQACFSTFHFHRIFRGMMGESVGEFVRRVRLERAAWRLANGARVTETAFEAGFESHEAFTRAFRAAFNVPPSRIKRANTRFFALPTPNGVHYDPSGLFFVLRELREVSDMNVEIRSQDPFRTACIRHTGPYWMIGPAFGRLRGWAAANGIPWSTTLAIYHDNPEITPPDQLRSDACLIVPSDFQTDDPGVHILDIPGGEYAVATHIGAYDGLPTAWNKFMGEWLPNSGREIGRGYCFEVYVDDCETTAVEQLRTELYEPLKTERSKDLDPETPESSPGSLSPR
jgi:AraC family transcriptional regulator